MFKFAYTYILYGLAVVVPLAIIIFWAFKRYKRKTKEQFGNSAMVNKLIPNESKSHENWKFYLFFIAVLLIIVGIAGPQVGSKLVTIKRKGIELILALDVSNSMLAEDLKPNRLENAKRAIEKLVDRLQNDKIGLVIFAGDAYTQLPITTDYVSAKMFLNTITPSSVPVQGTDLTKALEHAANSFTPDSSVTKAIVLITDGENHEESAVDAATEIANEGIKIYTIGMGSPDGVPIPIRNHFGRQDFKTDKDGNIVVSKLNEELLQKIAAIGKGSYFRANNATTGLNNIFDQLDKLDKKELESQIYADYENHFQALIVLGLILLLIEFFIPNRKSKLADKVQIFKLKI